MKKAIILAVLGLAPVFASTPCIETAPPAAGSTIAGDLDVPSGHSCTLNQVTVTGNVTVEGVLFTSGAQIQKSLVVIGAVQTLSANPAPGVVVLTNIGGDVTVSGAWYVMFRDTKVTGTVNISNVGTAGGLLYLVNMQIGKLLQVQGNEQSLKVESVSVVSNAIFSNNDRITLLNNTFGKNLNCGGNGAVAGSGNQGSLHGDCSALY
jgi:hypothetical protein